MNLEIASHAALGNTGLTGHPDLPIGIDVPHVGMIGVGAIDALGNFAARSVPEPLGPTGGIVVATMSRGFVKILITGGRSRKGN